MQPPRESETDTVQITTKYTGPGNPGFDLNEAEITGWCPRSQSPTGEPLVKFEHPTGKTVRIDLQNLIVNMKTQTEATPGGTTAQ